MLKPEQIDHINLINWFGEKYPELEEDFHHFANERRCTFNEGRVLKRMGVKKGIPDFFLAISMHGKHGLWIELKVGKNKATKEQLLFANRKINNGYEVVFAWGLEAAKEIILIYLHNYIVNPSQ